MDRQEVASFTASTLSALGVAATVVYHALETLLPVLLIILTVSLSYFFTRLNSRDTRKYEIRRFEIDEALGPLYGQILKIQESFDRNQSEFRVNYITTWDDEWSRIRYSQRFFVIQEPLRSEVEAYFAFLGRFLKEHSDALQDILEIEKRSWLNIGGIREVQSSAQFRLLTPTGTQIGTNLQSALYYGANPNEIEGGKYDYLTVSGIMLDGRNGNYRPEDPKAMRNAIQTAWDVCYPEVQKNPRIVKSQKERPEVMTETTRLRLTLEEEFKKWAT